MVKVLLLSLLFSLPVSAMSTRHPVLSLSSSSDTDDAPGMPMPTPEFLGRARNELPTRRPLSRSISVNRIAYGTTTFSRINDPRLEEYVRLIIYEDPNYDGTRFEAMRVLVGVKIFRFPRGRIVRVITRSTGATFPPVETMQIIGLE